MCDTKEHVPFVESESSAKQEQHDGSVFIGYQIMAKLHTKPILYDTRLRTLNCMKSAPKTRPKTSCWTST